MEKVIKYIKYLGGELISENERSHYFLLKKKIIRVSDHIGLNSSGNMNVIVTPSGYLIWNRSTGDIDIINYEDLKTLIRHINVLPSVNVESEKIDLLLKNISNTPNGDNGTILGYKKEQFSEKQIKQIESYITQLKKKTK